MIPRIAFRLLRMRDRNRYPIVCRVSMRYSVLNEGTRTYKPIQFTTGLSIRPEEWDTEKQRACTTNDKKRGLRACIDHHHINSTIERIHERCRLIIEDIRVREFDGLRVNLQEAKELFTSDKILYRLRGVQERPSLTAGVLEWLRAKVDGDTTSDGTKTSRRNTIKLLQAYHEATAPSSLLCWETLTRDYLEQFRSWMVTDRQLSNSTINKQIKTLRTFLTWAKEAGKVTAPMKIAKLKEQTDGGKMYLSPEDIDALCALELDGGERDARDWFVISCGTGIRVGDIEEITADNLIPVKGKSWEYEITHLQGKTKNVVSIPIVVPQVVRVFERLQWKFPEKRTSQYINRTLKELARQAGLTAPTEEINPKTGKPLLQCETIAMHTGRRSFATNAYRAGIPLATIKEITGHSDIATLEIYLRQTNEEKKEEFAQTYTKQ